MSALDVRQFEEVIKHMGEEDIRLGKAYTYYWLRMRNMHRKWRYAILAKERVG
jgi:hypothetical protein